MLNSMFSLFQAISLLARVGGGWAVGGGLTIKLNSAQLELDLGLSLAKIWIVPFLFCGKVNPENPGRRGRGKRESIQPYSTPR
jgi:hypothetical protein